MNVLTNTITKNDLALMTFLKPTVKLAAFFLGHPVYLCLTIATNKIIHKLLIADQSAPGTTGIVYRFQYI